MNNPFIPEKETIIRFFISTMNAYIDDNNEFDQKLIDNWETEMQPFLIKKYPPIIKGKFNINSDMEYLIKIIDELSEKYKKINETKNAEKITHIEKNNNVEKCQTNIDDENYENLSKFPISNQIKIRNKISKFSIDITEFSKDICTTLKRSNSMINIRPKSDTIVSKTTRESSNLLEDNNNLKINELVSGEDTPKNHINNFDEILNNNNLSEKENKQEDKKVFQRSKSMSLNNIMSVNYKIEDEKEGINIIYKETDKSLQFISPDLMLKKIIFDNFLETDTLTVHDFCEQCFSFLNKETYFKKIFNCYKFYKNSDTPFENLKNLIDFVGILVIEMYEYYNTLDMNDPTIILIKNFYHELINDLLYTKEKNNNEEKTDENQKNYSDNIDKNYEDFLIDKEKITNRNILLQNA